MRSYGTTSALPALYATRSEKAEEEESKTNNATKAAAGKAYKFGSPVKDKLDGTAQTAKQVAEDEAEYPCPSFFLLVLSSSRLPLLASPYVSLCSIFDYRTSYVEAKAKEGYDEAAYKERDACESARYNAKEAADKGSKKASRSMRDYQAQGT